MHSNCTKGAIAGWYNCFVVFDMKDRLLTRSIKVLALLVLAVVVLVYARPFLTPLTFAGLLAMLLLPLTLKMESWGWNRVVAILVALVLMLAVVGGLVAVLTWQASDLGQQSGDIQSRLSEKLDELKSFVQSKFGIPPQQQEKMVSGGSGGTGSKLTTTASSFIAGFGSFLTDLLITLVYTFLILFYRAHLKKFILMLVPANERGTARGTIHEARNIAQKYVSGLGLMIFCLWVLYGIGFSIVGVKSAILFAILCGLLEIVPFIGNLTGTAITLIAVLLQGGSTQQVMGVVITYATVQFLQSYILEPLVVGRGVRINPLFTIAGIVAGELVWGIAGMILAIPLMGMTKIVFDRIPQLKPYGFLMGEEKEEGEGVMKKVKRLFGGKG